MSIPVHDYHTPLVGRDIDRAAILACLKRLLVGQGGFLSIVGEAGMGKSRLVAEVTRLLPDTPLCQLEGHAFALTESISYAPFREILRAYANIAEGDSAAAGWVKLSQRVGALFPGERDEVLPYLALLSALEPAYEFAGRLRAIDSQAMRQEVFRAVRRFFERLAQQQPIWLVCEDWHWADAASEELAAHLLPLVESVPLLLCCVGRPDPDSPAVRFPQLAAQRQPLRSTWIRLGPLSSTHSAELLHALSPTAAAPLQEKILQLTAGNPFYVEEVARTLQEQTISAPRPAEILIPSSIQEAILNRVKPLGTEVYAVLQVAAVLGPSFSERMLREILSDVLSPDRHLETLKQRALLREERRPPGVGYAFQHALTQQAVYEAIPADRRRALHRQVGEWLETTLAAQEQEVYGLLAYHYACAEVWERAQRYLLAAGDQAGRLAADIEALEHYERALVAHERVFGERWEPFERAVLERKMGEARYRRGEHQEAKEHLSRALTLLGTPLPTSAWGVRVALARELARQCWHRFFSVRLPRLTAAPAESQVEERAQIYDTLSLVDMQSDPGHMLLDALLQLNVAEAVGFHLGIARASSRVALVCDFIPMKWLAEHYHRRGVTQAAESGQPTVIILAKQYQAWHWLQTGQWDAALEQLRQAEALCRSTGHWSWEGVACMLGRILLLRGDLKEAAAIGEELVRFSRDAADPEGLAWGLTVLGATLWAMGTVDEAIGHLQEASAAFAAMPDYQGLAVSTGSLGQCYVRQGELLPAQAIILESRAIIVARGVRGGLATPTRMALAEVCLAGVEAGSAPEHTSLLWSARQACRAAWRHTRHDRGALPEAARWLGTYNWLRDERAAAQRWWQESLEAAERLGARYELVRTHLEIGRRLGTREHLECAANIGAELGAAWDLAQARALLADM